jgi:hypothetical protein
VNVRLRESEKKAKFAELLFETEESKVVDIGGRELFGGVLQRKGKQRDFGAPDILGEIGIGTFHLYPRLFPRNYPGRIFNPVNNAAVNPLDDIIDGNRCAGILKATAAMIPGCRGEQGAVRGQDVEAQQSQFLDKGNKGMKDLLIQRFPNADTEIREGGLTGNTIVANAGKTAEVPAAQRIAQEMAEVFDGSNSFQITKQVEQKQRNGIIAGASDDGINIGGNGTDEGEIDNGSYKLGNTAADGAVVVDVNEFLAKSVTRKPAGLFLGKWFTVAPVDKRIDFPQLFDNIANCELNEFVHLKDPGVSREVLRPSKTLPGNPFLLVNAHHPTSPDPIQANASDFSLSTNTGGTALRRLSCT